MEHGLLVNFCLGESSFVAMVFASNADKTCWSNTSLTEWDLDIYAEYDYTTGIGTKPVTQYVWLCWSF